MRLNRRGFVLACLLCLIHSALGVSTAEARKKETGFLDRAVTVAGSSHKYQVFVPENWSPKQKWPIILFLHGAGERGEDGLMQTEVGIATAIRRDRNRFPAIVVIPQCAKDQWWTQSPMDDVAIATLNAATKEFHGDATRTYLTGLSMGGYGTWYLASKYPGRFAALAPICGGITLPEHFRKQHPELTSGMLPDDPKTFAAVAEKTGQTPVWIFHGGDDPVVSVTESRRMNDALKAAGGDVRYSEYPGVGHDSWNKAYAEPELFTWMLSKSLSSPKAK